MKVYKFKCKDCGSKKYEKVDEHIYKCVYCGCIEEVYNEQEQIVEQKPEITEADIDKKVKEALEESHRQEKKEKKKRSLYRLILNFFLGWIGIHRFYDRKYFTGLIYFFTWGLFGFGYTIDLLINIIKAAKEHSSYKHSYKNGESHE